MFRMTDEKNGDDKIFYVPAGDPRLEGPRDLDDVPGFYWLEIRGRSRGLPAAAARAGNGLGPRDQKPVTIGSLELEGLDRVIM